MRSRGPLIEWPTFTFLALSYAAFALGTIWLTALWLPLGMVVTTLAIVLHSSLTHEVVHGHPFRNQVLSEATVFPVLGLFVPYLRFKDTHLQHHVDDTLTDPYDDPESNYLDPAKWNELSHLSRLILRVNNTLLGRILIGPAIGQLCFMAGDLKAIMQGDKRILTGWLLHIPGVALVVVWVANYAEMSVWMFVLCAYFAYGILKIRTFLEHRAHVDPKGRTVIVEGACPLAWLFLFNSLHVVHHAHPGVPWYNLRARYLKDRDYFLSQNDGYFFPSYWSIFKQFGLRAKDPVAHPLWPKR